MANFLSLMSKLVESPIYFEGTDSNKTGMTVKSPVRCGDTCVWVEGNLQAWRLCWHGLAQGASGLEDQRGAHPYPRQVGVRLFAVPGEQPGGGASGSRSGGPAR